MERIKKMSTISMGGHPSSSSTTTDEQHTHKLRIYLHRFNSDQIPLTVDFHKRNTVEELIQLVLSQHHQRRGSHDSITVAAAATPHSPSSPSSSSSCFNISSLSLALSSNSNDHNHHNHHQQQQQQQELADNYELCEIMGTLDGQTCKERRLDPSEYPVAVQLLWPKSLPTGPDETTNLTEYRFVLREKNKRSGKTGFAVKDNSVIDVFLQSFLQQPKDKEYPDLCMLPELTEQTLLENLRDRFNRGHIYTYIGPILVAVNPFKFFPIYNPKYEKLYENQRRLHDLPPHVFAVADSAYHTMLRQKKNQCIVISGESGSGKTESTNFLLHHLTALSQKGAAGTGIEQTLLSGGPVLEAFGNSVTAQNNNSSRFGKFIQVNYRENGIVYGANVQIYLLEKSRITSIPMGERNYHVFYYLLAGATDEEKLEFGLYEPQNYNYLNQTNSCQSEGVDEKYEFKRLKQSMELVGFAAESQRKIFSVLSAVLVLGNIQYVKKSGYHSDDTAFIANPEAVKQVSQLLQVKEEKLLSALTTKRTVTKTDTVLTRYKVAEATATRDAMAKSLYNALFDWIVLRINQALMKKDSHHYYHHQQHQQQQAAAASPAGQGPSTSGVATATASSNPQPHGFNIGILDIFGFEDVGAQWNSFEQFCINYANERLQAYFNEHIFQFEQEEYMKEGLSWTAIEYTDNTECLKLIQSKPYGLFSLIDEESNIPKGTDESLLEKLNKYHKNHEYYEMPHKKEPAFIIAHYAGKVKYQVTGFREKNRDLMRQDVVNALKNSKSAFVRELVGTDPVAVFRWAVVRAAFRALFAFKQAARNMHKAGSIQHLNVTDESRGGQRRSSESQLNALLRGDIDERKVPSFCDTSVFSTILEHASSNGKAVVPNGGATNSRIDPYQSIKPKDSKQYKQIPPWHNRQWWTYSSSSSSSEEEDSNSGSEDSSDDAKDGFVNPSDCLPSLADRRRMEVANGLYSRTYVRELILNIEDQLVSSRKSPFRKKPTVQPKSIRGLQALRALAGRRPVAGRKMPSTVGAQFQHSLGRLMDSLGHANPFFIRCIRSNNEKRPCFFDEDIILRQLRYTGMLETVRIRRAGYSVRLSYEEFAFHYRILLPNGNRSSKEDVTSFIYGHQVLDRHNIQFGHTKMFMRDAEKLLLDDQLHKAIMTQILRLQSWFRTFILRQRFLRSRRAAIKIQANIRGWLVRRRLQRRTLAALCIQTYWRRYSAVKEYRRLRAWMIQLQALSRGLLVRRCYQHSLAAGYAKYNTPFIRSDQVRMIANDGLIVTNGEKIGSPVHSDEGILTKASSQDELPPSISPPGTRTFQIPRFRRSDSEESSGILENAEFSDSDNYNQSIIRGNRTKMLQDRSPSLDATFVLEDKRLKLIRVDELKLRPDGSVDTTDRPRRPSLTPAMSATVKAELTARLRRAASSDHLLTNKNNAASRLSDQGPSSSAAAATNGGQKAATMAGASSSLSYVQEPPSGSKSPSKLHRGGGAGGSGGSFIKAKRQLKALLSRRAESFQVVESDDEDEAINGDYDVASSSSKESKKIHAKAHLTVPAAKPKAFSIIPGDRATIAALSAISSSTTHSFKKGGTRLPNRTEPCAVCMKSVGGFLSHSFKCSKCKLCFHKECVEFASTLPCTPTSPPTAKHQRPWDLPSSFTLKKSFDTSLALPTLVVPDSEPTPPPKMTWNLTRTSQFHDPTVQVLGTLEDLRQMGIFIFKKIMDLNLKSQQQQQRETAADAIYRKALESFHTELLSHQATLKEEQMHIKYVDLIASFEGVLLKVSKQEGITFPVNLGVNGFRGYLNEFVNTKKKKDKIKAKEKFQSLRKKRRKSDQTIVVQGHRFKPDLVHVPTFCEVCNQFMWHAEKIFICHGCRISCHKKCHLRVVHPCSAAIANNGESTATNFVGRFFGADLSSLIDDDHTTPIVFEKLLSTLELRGLFAEGLYRKAGSVAQVKQVRRQIEETPDFEQITFDELPIHVLSSLVKAFLRELTEPLMTYDFYENFLTVAEVNTESERIRCIYAMVELLPKTNKCVLDRLMFHLARVAHQSDINRMSSQNLAVIFAPCLLKRQQAVKAQEQLEDSKRQTICIQTLIDEKLKHYLSTISDIIQLESAQEKVEENIRRIDEHMTLTRGDSGDSSVAKEMEQARLLFAEQIEFLDQVRDKLIEELPPMAPTASSEDDCLTSSDENTEDGPYSHRKSVLQRQRSNAEEYAIDMSIPPLFSNLVHLTRDRTPRPVGQRKPQRYSKKSP